MDEDIKILQDKIDLIQKDKNSILNADLKSLINADKSVLWDLKNQTAGLKKELENFKIKYDEFE